MTGFDLAPAMVAAARAANPAANFEVANLNLLLRPPAAAAWGAITAWYALSHLAGSELGDAIGGLARVLAPGGWLGLAVQVGHEILSGDSYLGHDVPVEVVLHDPEQVLRAVTDSGLVVAERYLRGPVADEVDTDRFYVLAWKPDVTG